MAKEKLAMTPALRMLKAQGVAHEIHSYPYEEKGGTAKAARELNLDEHQVIKTLVFETEGRPFLVLMHGDRQVSTKNLARSLEVKTVDQTPPDEAQRHTGYQVGGISPFGTRKKLQVLAEASIFELPRIYINAGKRGLLVAVNPKELVRVLDARPVQVGI